MGNAYLDRRAAREDAIIAMAQAQEQQYLCDIFSQLLYDKYGFAEKRLLELLKDVIKMHDDDVYMFYPKEPEADVKREHYDRKLKQIFPTAFAPFDERYPHAHKIFYGKHR